jgi:hypothetical protein
MDSKKTEPIVVKQVQIDAVKKYIIDELEKRAVAMPEGLAAIIIATIGLIVNSNMDAKSIRTIIKGFKKSLKDAYLAYEVIKENEPKPTIQEKIEVK